MTLYDAVNAVAGFTPPDVNITNKALIDLQLDPAATYSYDNHKKNVDKAAISVLMALKVLAKIDQGGFGVTFNSEEADKTINFVYSRSGGDGPNPLEDNSKPTINSIGNRW